MVIKVLVSGISASKEVKKRQQRAMLILDSAQVEYEPIDITEPGRDDEKANLLEAWKLRKGEGCTVPLPPQFFNDEDYLGDFEDFNLAVDVNEILQFLKLEKPEEVQTNGNLHQENQEVTRVSETSPKEEEEEEPTEKKEEELLEAEEGEEEAESGERAGVEEPPAESASDSAAKRKEAEAEEEGDAESGDAKKFKPVASDEEVEEVVEAVTSPDTEETKVAVESEEEQEEEEEDNE